MVQQPKRSRRYAGTGVTQGDAAQGSPAQAIARAGRNFNTFANCVLGWECCAFA